MKKRLPTKAVEHYRNVIGRYAGKMPSKQSYRRNLVHTGLVFADKFFEANGAFVAFRRSYFMGERDDRRREMREKGWSVEDAAKNIVLDETNKRIKAYSNLNSIPKRFHPFVKYQAHWQYRLKEGLEKNESWATHLATVLFKEGLKEKPRSLEQTIREYKPIAGEDAEFKQETLRYLNGVLWQKFLQN